MSEAVQKSPSGLPRKTSVSREDFHLSSKELVEQYTPLVHKIARGLARRNTDPLEDLIQVGMIGLLEASKRYDPKQAASFKTFATHYITGHIRHYLRDKQQLLKGPRSLRELSYRLHCITKKLSQELNREPSNCEVAEALEVSIERIQEVKKYDRRVKVLWLDQEMNEHSNNDGGKRSLIDTVSDDEGTQDKMDTRILINQAIERLEPFYQELLKLRYFEDLTQADIAARLEISQMEVCRKLKIAQKELKTLLFQFTD